VRPCLPQARLAAKVTLAVAALGGMRASTANHPSSGETVGPVEWVSLKKVRGIADQARVPVVWRGNGSA